MTNSTSTFLEARGGSMKTPFPFISKRKGHLPRSTLASYKVLRGTFRGSPPLAHVLNLVLQLVPDSLGDKMAVSQKGWFWRMYTRSGFRSGVHANVPSFRFFVPGNIRQNHPFGKPPFPKNIF